MRRIVPVVLLLLVSFTAYGMKAAGIDVERLNEIDESWYSLHLEDRKVGFINQQVLEVKDGGEKLVLLRAKSFISLKRLGQSMDIETNMDVLEKADGEPHSFLLTIKGIAAESIRYEGRFADGKIAIKSYAGGEFQSTHTIDWENNAYFPWSGEKKYRKALEEGGKKICFKAFIPDLNKMGETCYEVMGKQKTDFPGGDRTLTKVKISNNIMPQLSSFEWLDEEFNALKMQLSFMGMSFYAYRVPRELAVSDFEGPEFMTETLIEIDDEIPEREGLKDLTLMLTFRSPPAGELSFLNDPRVILLEKSGKKAYKIKIKKQPPPLKKGEPGKEPAEYLKPDTFIQSDYPPLKKTAEFLTADASGDWEKAKILVHWVNGRIEKKDLSMGFATAKDVYENMRGDCSEHSVLFVAAARSIGLPAKGVTGLAYSGEWEVFGFHMWAEVFINGEWIAVDPTFGQELADPTHIKLGEGSGNIAEMGLGLLDVMANLDIDVLSYTIDREMN